MIEFHLPSFPEGYCIRTKRLLLRPPRLDDVEGLWPHVTDPALTQFLAWDPHTDRGETLAMVQSLIDSQTAGRGFHWIVCLDDQIVGLVSLIDVRRQHRCWTINRAELAYWIGSEFQRHGFATEASRAVIDFAFAALGFSKIVLYHASENTPSGRIPVRLGFRYVGEEREAFSKAGNWYSLQHYELLKSIYKADYEG